MAYLALFVALGGSAAAASVVISSNSQVAKNTISGHNPPSGDHSNIIGKSITGADIKIATLTGVNAATLNGVSSVNLLHGGGQVVSEAETVAGGGTSTLTNINGWGELSVGCRFDPDGTYVSFVNESGKSLNYAETGSTGTSPTAESGTLSSNDDTPDFSFSSPGTYSVTLQLSPDGAATTNQVETITATVNLPSSMMQACTFQAQATAQ